MSNPWLKKNPFMSLWLSTANRMAGSVRSQATAETKRQVKAAVAEATRDSMNAWFKAVAPPAEKKTTARKPVRKR
jgi:hypothetical protein